MNLYNNYYIYSAAIVQTIIVNAILILYRTPEVFGSILRTYLSYLFQV